MRLSKVFSIVLIAVILVVSLNNIAFARDIGGIMVNSTKTEASNKVGSFGANLLGIIQTVGTIAAIVTLIILGIKYMMGSAEEKAEYKKTLMPYVVGAVLVLAASNIVTWIFEAGTSLF